MPVLGVARDAAVGVMLAVAGMVPEGLRVLEAPGLGRSRVGTLSQGAHCRTGSPSGVVSADGTLPGELSLAKD